MYLNKVHGEPPLKNAEVERSLSVNSKVLTSERSLLSDDSINVIKLTKDAI